MRAGPGFGNGAGASNAAGVKFFLFFGSLGFGDPFEQREFETERA